MQTPKLERIAAGYTFPPGAAGLALTVEQPSTGFSCRHGEAQRPYFIASITKLFTAALIVQLCEEHKLTLDARASDLLGCETMAGLNIYDGRDFGSQVAIGELLAHTSGIPDYFEDKRPDGGTVLADLLKADRGWSFDELLSISRSMKAHFAPSTPRKAFYSDTNYMLLGRIVEILAGCSYENALRNRIFQPLALEDTWLFTPATLDRYREVTAVMYRNMPLHTPRALASFAAEGAIVSTMRDQIRFLRAFVGGELFPKTSLTGMTAQWRSIFSPLVPLSYGIGVMRFSIPRWQSPFFPVPAMIGHSGVFGTMLFYVPDRDLYIAGTVNQMVPRSLAYRLLVRIALAF
ncbi:serine hydrolase domain-containing protein [Agrobacterium burrii]|uniref:Beta-lactamase family protein n=1 Tax=Agrobacterium burrii TaxID=2815339 RepID=A0ABS3EBW7_9HYPH|nr:serine hydrolase domain-containing protein [Agrobacterium burrii]MBO0129357.1 beta-lactamase family protein [Agrobacterium burrii]